MKPSSPAIAAILTYALALAAGVAAAFAILPWAAMLGEGGGWNPPNPDAAQALTGHLAFQADAWRWPLLDTTRMFWPGGISIALTDSNPLLSLLAKLWVKATGSAPVNLFGAWLAVCWIAQPIAGVYAARGLRLSWPASLAAGLLVGACPAMVFRMGHLNLVCHFILLLALGMTIRRSRQPLTWVPAAVLLSVASLSQPYLFQLAAVVLAAVPIQATLTRRPGWRREWAGYLASGVVGAGTLIVLSGPLGGGDKGFVFFSMNLLSPVWPQQSGIFGADLPIIDATGGQYEGYNWMGAGVALLAAVALARLVVLRPPLRPSLRPYRALIAILAGLAVLSLSDRVYAGRWLLVDLGAKPWEDIFGTFRTPGRGFWPVGYAITLASVAAVARLRPVWAAPLLIAAVALQIADTEPMRAGVRLSYTLPHPITPPAVPTGTTLLAVAPHPGCSPPAPVKSEGPVMLLRAVEAGARIADVGLGRSPRGFACERVISDALELPLLPGEARAFFSGLRETVRPERLGPGTVCGRTGDATVCGRDVGPIEGEPVAVPPPPAPIALPAELTGDGLAAFVATGWARAGDVWWSEGPRASIVVPVPAGRPLTLRVTARGVAVRAGEPRDIAVSAGRQALGVISLPDDATTTVTLRVPAGPGLLRLAFDVVGRAIDPRRRALTAPVQRAAIRLERLSIAADP